MENSENRRRVELRDEFTVEDGVKLLRGLLFGCPNELRGKL
jgi:hypothetical protein